VIVIAPQQKPHRAFIALSRKARAAARVNNAQNPSAVAAQRICQRSVNRLSDSAVSTAAYDGAHLCAAAQGVCMFSKKFLSGAALTALSMAMPGVAHAQSTASQIQEEDTIIVTGQRRSMEGTMTAEQAPKARATVTQEYIGTQAPGQTVLDTLNLIPGVNFTSTDAFGASGGAINMRGFDGARISLTVDGIPLNDTGNYAIYSNQQVDPELIERANVNLGTTDIDSPTASAVGGTINYVTRTPGEDFGVMASLAGGSENFHREFLLIDTGALGPLGTRAFLSGSFTEYDQFVGPGELQKKQYNGGIY
jgi:iron complex outermembrane recepter protein